MAVHIGVALLLLLQFGVVDAVPFSNPDLQYFFTYSSVSDVLGMHNVTTIVKFHLLTVNSTSSEGVLFKLHVDSFVQHSPRGYAVTNPRKWNLTKDFLFHVGADGQVSAVHHHPEEEDEVLTLKKALAGTLSMRIQVDDSSRWTYEGREVDHQGDLHHKYTCTRHSDGLTVTRVHQSSDDVNRQHEKIMEFAHDGSIRHITCHDNVTLHREDTTAVMKRKPIPGEYHIEDEMTSEFPSISTMSLTRVMLDRIRPREDALSRHFHGLKRDSIVVKKVPERKVSLMEIQKKLSDNLACIRKFDTKFAQNRTECVQQLREALDSLHEEDYVTLAAEFLSKNCTGIDSVCQDERDLFVDLVASKGDPSSQHLVIQHVFRNASVDEEQVRRPLFHYIALKHPIPETISEVEKLCFGEQDELHGSQEMAKTTRRACLTLGALARTLADLEQHGEAERLVSKLESWLGHYNHSHSEPILRRRKRSATETDFERHHHVITKMVLLHSLGNARLPRSQRHIRSYLEPNRGASAWRRAALRSFRNHTGPDSLLAVFDSAVHDSDRTVRLEARRLYSVHPLRHQMARQKRDLLLSRNYTYTKMLRLKRDIFEFDFSDGVSMKLTLPSINWDKIIGSSNIGAGVGLHINNGLDLSLKPLSGHFKVDIYDEAYAEAHAGVVNVHVTIFRARICYRGHIEYDLNVLKDFGINGFKDLLHLFEKIFTSIVNPVKDAIDTFKKIVSPGYVKSLFDALINFIKNLPNIVRQFIDDFVEMVKKMVEYHTIPIIEKVKAVVQKVRSLIEEIQADALEFYHAVVDSVLMTIPNIGKNLKEGVDAIIEFVKLLVQQPSQAMAKIGVGIKKISISIAMFVDAKNRIVEAAGFLFGGKAFWMSIGEEIHAIIDDFRDIVSKMTQGFTSVTHQGAGSGTTALQRTDGFLSPEGLLEWARADLERLFHSSLSGLDQLKAAADPFFNIFKDIMDLVRGVKEGFEAIRSTIDKTRSLFQKIFGPKFHVKFPSHRREGDATCPEGKWPSTAGNRYKTHGVEVISNIGSSVKSPVDGTVQRRSDTELLIHPTDPHFTEYEILLANVRGDDEVSFSPRFFQAGTKIGSTLKSDCMPNFIHLAVRKKTGSQMRDEDYVYVDPSPFLDRLVPIPQWIEDCNDHVFEHIGHAFDSGGVADEGSEEEEDDYKSKAMDRMEKMMDEHPDPEPPYRPDDLDSGGGPNFGDSLKQMLEPLTDMGSLLASSGMPSLEDLLGINLLTLKKVRGMIQNNQALVSGLDELVSKLAEKMREAPVADPDSLSLFHIGHRLLEFQQAPLGDRVAMVLSLLRLHSKACSNFGNSVEAGHVCTPHHDCKGITCGVALTVASIRKLVKVDLRVHEDKLYATSVSNQSTLVPMDGHVTSILLQSTWPKNMELTPLVHVQAVQSDSDTVKVSMDAVVCSRESGTCLPTVHVLHELPLPHRRGEVATGNGSSYDPYVERVENMNLKAFIEDMSSFGMETKDGLALLNKIRMAVMTELFNNKDVMDKVFGAEFKDKTDICISGKVPVPPFDIQIIPDLTFFYMVGPVPMSLQFGASGSLGLQVELGFCLMSMTFSTTLTPWVAGKVWGSINIDIGFAFGGLKLIGYLLETRFPIRGELVFSKCPIDTRAKMDFTLVPIRLELKAHASLRLIFITVTVFEANIWQYKAPSITKNIFDTHKKGADNSPPDFQSNTYNARTKRQGKPGCQVTQIKGRDSSDPAFKLEVSSSDEISDVKVQFAVGTHPGGTDAMDWTELGGPSLTYPSKTLPHSVPLHYTVKARNSQGLEAVTQCSLSTFDTTLPDGRVDASFSISSNPSTLSATVVVFEDSELQFPQRHALGLSPGAFSQELLSWTPFSLGAGGERSGVSGDLRHFSPKKPGRLAVEPLRSVPARTEEECASACLRHGGNCVAVSFEQHEGTCQLHEVVEGARARLGIEGQFVTLERLDVGHTHFLEYGSLDLRHGTSYYVNVEVRNALGYVTVLSSPGTLVDLTPPTPGPVGQPSMDVVRAEGCKAAPTQRCAALANLPNHRVVVDGDGAATVFNGGTHGVDQRYTSTNNFIKGNWDGFYDNETGIFGYTWSVGRNVCTDDVIAVEDPHANLSSPQDWTYTGQAANLHLQDGHYYVTVQAINNVVHGGALVTTVCHSAPLIVDTTPPDFRGIQEIFFDQDFRLLGLHFRAEDSLTGVASLDFGVGMTKYDVKVRGYGRVEFRQGENMTSLVEDFTIPEGVPAWIKLRVTNKAGLFSSGSSEQPILLDSTAPTAGSVGDGGGADTELDFQADVTKACGHWQDFFDKESGISGYRWGVGTRPGLDDVVTFTPVDRYQHSQCHDVTLLHNHTYFSTVVATNAALNLLSVNSSSNGVLVDVTPPVPGWVHDGTNVTSDVQYTSERALVATNWGGFSDPESGIDHYSVAVLVNSKLKSEENVDRNQSAFSDNSLSLKQGDTVNFRLTAHNRAGASVQVSSDGFTVDLTPPVPDYIRLAPPGVNFQSDLSYLLLGWAFSDADSGIDYYKVSVFEEDRGARRQFWPTGGIPQVYYVTSDPPAMTERLSDVTLTNGAQYVLQVTAVNRALFPKADRSLPLTIDSTPPVLDRVHIGLPGEEEELDDQGRVLQYDREQMAITWSARDMESGVTSVEVALGTAQEPTLVTGGYVTLLEKESARLQGLELQESGRSGQVYRLTIRATNGAGLHSNTLTSKDIWVPAANVPGQVWDGRDIFRDATFQHDVTSLAMSFSGFASEACGIVGYDWAVGSQPFFSDAMPFTDFGIVMANASAGFAQAHLELKEGATYYVTVRALTGDGCYEEAILSSSDGLTVSSSPPAIAAFRETGAIVDDVSTGHVIYQGVTDDVDATWNVSDTIEVTKIDWCLGSLPGRHDVTDCHQGSKVKLGDVRLAAGHGTFLRVEAEDAAGNRAQWTSAAITPDMTSPSVSNLTCTQAVSVRRPVVTCQWAGLEERESHLANLTVCLGSEQGKCDVIGLTVLALDVTSWQRDLDRRHLRHLPGDRLYVTVNVSNVLGLYHAESRRVVIDRTPPISGRVAIVTSDTLGGVLLPRQCQTVSQYVESLVQDFDDPETGIEGCELALETTEGAADVSDFRPVTQGRVLLTSDLALVDGMHVRAVARCSNMAGQVSVASSAPVVVSSSPRLTVWDGSGQADQEFQTSLTTLSGRWFYSDPCPVQHAQWRVERLDGHVVQDDIPLALDGSFSSDVIRLENGVTYVSVVRVVDALNRTREGRSDGVTVQIATPYPGAVRDGADEDRDYQSAMDTLRANWDAFGDPGSSDIAQTIVRYEVAVGDDNRYTDTRSNVQAFVSVGLNTSASFSGLKLTAKAVTYYVTVRAVSAAGSAAEATSDGIRVGYDLAIHPGMVSLPRFSTSPGRLTFSWEPFLSELGLEEYRVVVTDSPPSLPASTFTLASWSGSGALRVSSLSSVGLDTAVTLKNLSLQQGGAYYAVVLAVDRAGRAIAASAGPVIVDLTPPVPGTVTVKGEVYRNAIFINSTDEVTVAWQGFEDPDSNMTSCYVRLYVTKTCIGGDNFTLHTMEVHHGTLATFYRLTLDPEMMHGVDVTCLNGAGAPATAHSPPLLLDTIAPARGDVKAGPGWKRPISFQHVTDVANATLAVASSPSARQCHTKRELLPSPTAQNLWSSEGESFSEKAVLVTDKKMYISVGFDKTLTQIQSGGLKTGEYEIKAGNYTIEMVAARGPNIITAFKLGLSDKTPADVYVYPDLSKAGIVDGIVANGTNATQLNSSSTKFNLTTFDNSTDSSNSTDTSFLMPTTLDVGFTLAIYGWHSSGKWWSLWAVKDGLQDKIRWVELPVDPTSVSLNYSLRLSKDVDETEKGWTLEGFLDQDLMVRFKGVQLAESMAVYVETVSNAGYQPPLDDPLHAAYTQTVVTSVSMPPENDSSCLYGHAFFDDRSGLKELWVSVSSGVNVTGDVSPMALHRSFCRPCPRPACPVGCDPDCQPDVTFDVMTLSVANVNLAISRGVGNLDDVNETSLADKFSAPTYYVNVEAVDFAGHRTAASTEGFMVDVTPPEFQLLFCSDPSHSMDEPVTSLGTNSSIGAFWECQEDASDILRYKMAVGTKPGTDDIYPETSVGLRRKVGLKLEGDPIVDGKIYYVTVTAENSAGLMTSLSCNVTAELTPPKLSDNATSNATYMTSLVLPDRGVAFTSFQDKVGLELDNAAGSNIMYYEWSLGTGDGKEDVFPRVVVGNGQQRKVAIRQGELFLDERPANHSLADHRNTTSTAQPPQEAEDDSGSDGERSFLLLEPGRCYHHGLRAITRAHVTAELPTTALCVKRYEDFLLDLKNSSQSTSIFVNDTAAFSSSASQTFRASVTVKGLDGLLYVGSLTDDDTTAIYGSPATADYLPYIGQVYGATSLTSRLLSGRLLRYTGSSFFMAPAPVAVLEGRAVVTPHFPDFDGVTNVTVLPAVWSPVLEQWIHWDELCPLNKSGNCEIGEAGSWSEEERIEEHSDVIATTLYTPLHVALFEAWTEVQNLPPAIHSRSLQLEEDRELLQQIDATDPENDKLRFAQVTSASHGVSSISETGHLRYVPHADFCGEDTVEVMMTEVDLPPGVTPHVTKVILNVHVQCENDAPRLSFVPASGHVYDAESIESVTVTWKGQTLLMSPLTSLACLVLSDVDSGQTLDVILDRQVAKTLGLRADRLNTSQTPAFLPLQHWQGQNFAVFQLSMARTTNVPEDTELRIIGKDSDDFYSLELKVLIQFRDILCSGAGCGLFAVEGMQRESAKKFLEYIQPALVHETTTQKAAVLPIPTPMDGVTVKSEPGNFTHVQFSKRVDVIIASLPDGHVTLRTSSDAMPPGTSTFSVLGEGGRVGVRVWNQDPPLLASITQPSTPGGHPNVSRLLKDRTQGLITAATLHLDKDLRLDRPVTFKHQLSPDSLAQGLVPVLLYLTQNGIWQSAAETCGQDEQDQDGVYTATLCSLVLRPDADLQLALVAATRGVQNKAAVLQPDTLTVPSSPGGLTAPLPLSDPDGDTLRLQALLQPPRHGKANVSADLVLHFEPDKDFSGKDQLVLAVRELEPDVVTRLTLHLVVLAHTTTQVTYVGPDGRTLPVSGGVSLRVSAVRTLPAWSFSLELGSLVTAGPGYSVQVVRKNPTVSFLQTQPASSLPAYTKASDVGLKTSLDPVSVTTLTFMVLEPPRQDYLYDVTVTSAEAGAVDPVGSFSLVLHVTEETCKIHPCLDVVTAYVST